MRRLFAPLVVVAAVASLSGCGKAGRPVQPPDSTYPHVYPNPALGPAPTPAKPVEGRAIPPEWDQQDLKERFTPNGTYVDPSVRATITTPSGVPLGSNLPNSRVQPGNNPMEQGLGQPSMSPLPPYEPPTPEGQEQPQ